MEGRLSKRSNKSQTKANPSPVLRRTPEAMRLIHWFRSDLRITDNTSLLAACNAAKRGVVTVYVVSPEEWASHDMAPIQVDYRLRALAVVAEDLRALSIPLRVLMAKKQAEIPEMLVKLAREVEADGICFNREYEIDEARRDQRVMDAFTRAGLRATGYVDQTALAPELPRTGNGTYFTVFTPFKKAWLKVIAEGKPIRVGGKPKKQGQIAGVDWDVVPTEVKGFDSHIDEATRLKLWPAGEHLAQQWLKDFISKRGKSYKDQRDIPSVAGTSKLSPALAIGTISPRQCLAEAMEANDGKLDGGEPGLSHWIGEVIWREFYVHVTVGFPRVCMNRAFKRATDRIEWSYDEKQFEAWKKGMTGYPIVDAAMRQLNATGWMHNRLRMVAAMFLTKDLFIDWRWGEKYFMQNLIDGFLASNNGGWQWSASTGTDAAPYFRIFNPISQSEKFDPQGAFIRHYVPELKSLSSDEIHDPAPLTRSRCGYPMPIVDHSKARDRVFAAFKQADPSTPEPSHLS